MMGSGWHHMTGWAGGWGWVGMTLMMLVWVVVLALMIYAVVRLTGGASQRREPADDTSRAEGILRERYARGELSEEEYRKARDTLRETAP